MFGQSIFEKYMILFWIKIRNSSASKVVKNRSLLCLIKKCINYKICFPCKKSAYPFSRNYSAFKLAIVNC